VKTGPRRWADNGTKTIQGYSLNLNTADYTTRAILGSYGGEFEDSCLLSCCAIALKMEAPSASETSVNFYCTTWRNNTEDGHLYYIYIYIYIYIFSDQFHSDKCRSNAAPLVQQS
jgi:hypothetical protein